MSSGRDTVHAEINYTAAFTDPRASADCAPRASVEMRTIAYWFE